LFEGQAPPPGSPLSRLLDVVPVPIHPLKLERTVLQVRHLRTHTERRERERERLLVRGAGIS
jgi:hypothetical protein